MFMSYAQLCDKISNFKKDEPVTNYVKEFEDLYNQARILIHRAGNADNPVDAKTFANNASYANRPDLYEPAAEFAKSFFDYADKVCVENPVGRLSTLWRKPDQYVQPWMFGHKETKKTGLWLKNLPLLKPTDNVYEEMMELSIKERNRIWYMGSNKNRSVERSITYQGIADAMAEQWGV